MSERPASVASVCPRCGGSVLAPAFGGIVERDCAICAAALRERPIAEAEALAFLRAIETGAIALTTNELPLDVYAGNVTYRASNGWTIVVFNDCDSFDYVDEIKTDDGRWLDFDNMTPALKAYRAPDSALYSAYQFPRPPGVVRTLLEIAWGHVASAALDQASPG